MEESILTPSSLQKKLNTAVFNIKMLKTT